MRALARLLLTNGDLSDFALYLVSMGAVAAFLVALNLGVAS